MRTVVAMLVAVLFLCVGTVLAAPVPAAKGVPPTHSFVCKELADNARDHQVKIRLGLARAEVENYWGDSRRDQGELKASKSTGDRVYKGFPHWVSDGVEGSGYLFVSKKLLKDGKGVVSLYSRFCKETCATRTAKLNCRAR